jgi:hypothetical protein
MLSHMNITLHPQSRLPAALALFRRLNTETVLITADDVALQTRVAEAQRTIWEFFCITYAAYLRRHKPSPVFPTERIRLALAGAEQAASDSNHLHRNTQFELYVAALLCLGGGEVSFAEPDLSLLVGSRTYGVAVKRMASEKPDRVAVRLREGAAQIQKSKTKGYLAVNIDVHYRGQELSQDAEVRTRLFNAKTSVVWDLFRRECAEKPHVKGLLLFGYSEAWNFDGDIIRHPASYPTSYRLIEDSVDDAATRQVQAAFWDGCLTRMHRQLDYMQSGDFQG